MSLVWCGTCMYMYMYIYIYILGIEHWIESDIEVNEDLIDAPIPPPESNID